MGLGMTASRPITWRPLQEEAIPRAPLRLMNLMPERPVTHKSVHNSTEGSHCKDAPCVGSLRVCQAACRTDACLNSPLQIERLPIWNSP